MPVRHRHPRPRLAAVLRSALLGALVFLPGPAARAGGAGEDAPAKPDRRPTEAEWDAALTRLERNRAIRRLADKVSVDIRVRGLKGGAAARREGLEHAEFTAGQDAIQAALDALGPAIDQKSIHALEAALAGVDAAHEAFAKTLHRIQAGAAAGPT